MAVRAYHRNDRSLRADEGEAVRRVQNSELFRQQDLNEQFRVHLKALDTDAPIAVKGLQSSLMGCDWISSTLRGISESLHHGTWKSGFHKMAKSLLGIHNGDPNRDITEVDQWALIIDEYVEYDKIFNMPYIHQEWEAKMLSIQGLIAGDQRENELIAKKKKHAEDVCEKYLNMIDLEIARLKEARASMVELDEVDKAAARERALVDTSEAGKLRMRYIGEAQRDVFKALDQVAKLDGYTSKLAGRTSRNEANSPDAPPPTHA